MPLLTIRRVPVLVCVLFAATLQAQQMPSSTATAVPQLVRVTGWFRPANGLPAAPVEIVTLAIYAEETGGAPLWQETQNVTVEADGRYTLLLGSTRTAGLPLDLFESGEARWLGTHVERPGEGEQTRVQLASVPYALRASDAATLGGRLPSAYLLAEPGASEGRASTNAGDAKTPANAVSSFTIAGTPNAIGKFYSGTDMGDSAMYETGGRVGVGTAAPFDSMHVRFADTSGTMTGYAVQNLGTGPGAYSGMLFYDQTGVLGQFQGFNNSSHEYRINNIATGGSINFMTGSTSRFLVANNGNIGIGATLPGSKLEVAGDINITTGGLIRRNGFVALRIDTTGNNYVGLGLGTPIGAVGENNTIIGTAAGSSISTGAGNSILGSWALSSSGSAPYNTALGYLAMAGATSGSGNVVVGAFAAANKPSGNENIYLGVDVANSNVNAESGTIRIGDAGFNSRAFIGGIRGVTTGAANAVSVFIDSNNQLGTVNSSRRYKEDIRDMGDASSLLMKLRPVTYRYTQAYADGSKPIDYGLIAEEVEELYPDLVAHLAGGEVETVQYHKINAMLLNEVQKQHRALQQQQSEIDALKARLAALETARQ